MGYRVQGARFRVLTNQQSGARFRVFTNQQSGARFRVLTNQQSGAFLSQILLTDQSV